MPVIPGGLVELGYATKTSTTTVSNTYAGGGNDMGLSLTVVCDGGPIMVDFYCPSVACGSTSGDGAGAILKMDGTEQAVMGALTGASNQQIGDFTMRLTPSAGSHTFTIMGYKIGTGSASFAAAGSGAGTYQPMFLRVSKIVNQNDGLKPFWTPPVVTQLPSQATEGDQVLLYSASPYAGYQNHQYASGSWRMLGDSRGVGVWQSFTPTITQSASVTFNTNYAKYVVTGKTVTASFSISPTSSGTASNPIVFGFGSGSTALPTAANAASIHGSFRWFDSGVSNWCGTVIGNSTTSAAFMQDGNGNSVGYSGTLSSGDTFEGFFVYEAA